MKIKVIPKYTTDEQQHMTYYTVPLFNEQKQKQKQCVQN